MACRRLECKFLNTPLFENTINGAQKNFYVCNIDNVLADKSPEISIDTTENKQKNQDVEVFRMVKHDLLRIPDEIFLKFPQLEYLYLFNTGLIALKKGNFKNANSLKIMNLQRNEIRKLEELVFAGAEKLEVINLAYNKIYSIDPWTFRRMENLREIYLHGNQLETIPATTFSFQRNLDRVFLIGNKCTNKNYTKVTKDVEIVQKDLKSCPKTSKKATETTVSPKNEEFQSNDLFVNPKDIAPTVYQSTTESFNFITQIPTRSTRPPRYRPANITATTQSPVVPRPTYPTVTRKPTPTRRASRILKINQDMYTSMIKSNNFLQSIDTKMNEIVRLLKDEFTMGLDEDSDEMVNDENFTIQRP